MRSNRKRICVVLTMGIFLVGLAATSQAAQDVFATADSKKVEKTVFERAGITVSARIQGGYLTGEANELVYWPDEGGHTASKLTWKIDNIYMLGTGISVSPLRWLKINADVYVNVVDGNGTMDDYDWLIPGRDWSDWSHHENTDVTRGIIWDFSSEFTPTPDAPVRVTGILGYRMDFWEWEARGGSYVYSMNEFRDIQGDFPGDELGITYGQNFYVPYIGLGFIGDFGSFILKARILGSPLVWGTADDTHHMRNLETEDTFEYESWMGVDIAGEFEITPNVSLQLAMNYSNYDTMKGDTEWNFKDEGQRLDVDDGAGADLQTTMFVLTLLYNF